MLALRQDYAAIARGARQAPDQAATQRRGQGERTAAENPDISRRAARRILAAVPERRHRVRDIGAFSAVAICLVVAVVVVGCSSITPTGTVTGQIIQVGGPAGTPNQPVRGAVTLTNVSSGAKFHGTPKAKSGFSLAVPAGTYRVSGLSAQDFVNSHEMNAFPSPSIVTVRGNVTSRVNLYVEIS